ncbi:MAG: MazG family protein [Actinomycetota bacterium]|nr:MazG family protein [Actinomycetota bacterium]
MTGPSRAGGCSPIGAVAGSSLIDAVAVMDRLRSAGGCPWDGEQTHSSLLRYLVEECYELVQAIEDGDLAAIREELGDVLFQVLFHSRIAAETPAAAGGFTIDDVAADLNDKLIRRHPHVFAPSPNHPVTTVADQELRWDELKKAEKNGKSHVLDGVALAQPALALAGKLGSRAAKFGNHTSLPDGDSVAEQIFRLAYAAGAKGEDPELSLRQLVRAHADRMRAETSD